MSTRRFLQILLMAIATSGLSTADAADEKEAIIQATMRYVFQNAGVNDPAVTVEKIAQGFARVKVKSISGTTDPATAYLKGSGANWNVLVLGTGMSAADLAEFGIPASLAK